MQPHGRGGRIEWVYCLESNTGGEVPIVCGVGRGTGGGRVGRGMCRLKWVQDKLHHISFRSESCGDCLRRFAKETSQFRPLRDRNRSPPFFLLPLTYYSEMYCWFTRLDWRIRWRLLRWVAFLDGKDCRGKGSQTGQDILKGHHVLKGKLRPEAEMVLWI